jgi:putative transposase
MQKKNRKQYTAEFKAKVVKEMLREEKTIGQLAAQYEVHSNMLYRWREQALAGLPGLFSDQSARELAAKEAQWQQEREALYAEIGRLTTQVTWLEKNLAQGLSRQERRELVDWENKELPVSTQAELLILNRTGLYYQPAPPREQEVACKHRIDEISTAHPYYGYRRIAAQLHRDGQLINPKTVARCMQDGLRELIYRNLRHQGRIETLPATGIRTRTLARCRPNVSNAI